MFKKFIRKYLKFGLDKTTNRLEYQRVLLVNTLTLVIQGFIIGLTAIVIGYQLWIHCLIAVAAFFLIKPAYYLNRAGKFNAAAIYMVNFCVIAIVMASYFAFFESRWSEVENWILAFIAVSVFLFDKWIMRMHFWILTILLMLVKTYKFYLLGIPMEMDFVLLQVNTIILALGLFVFLLIFKEGLRRSLNKLEEADRMKSKMFTMVAHDLKSPFVLFETMIQASKDKLIGPEEFGELQENLQKRFTPIKNTVSELLDWSQAHLNEAEPIIERFDPKPIVDNISESVSMLSEHKGISIRLKNDVDELEMDKNHFTIVMRNLIHNAVKFSSPDSEVTITMMPNGTMNVVTVEDRGVGMEQETIQKVLKNELVKSQPGTNNEKGTGIGLNLAKELLDKNRVKLQIISHEGLGSKFILKVPKS